MARRKGYALWRLADHAGVSRGYLRDVVLGRKSPTVRTLSKIADALDVAEGDLFDFDAPVPAPPRTARRRPA